MIHPGLLHTNLVQAVFNSPNWALSIRFSIVNKNLSGFFQDFCEWLRWLVLEYCGSGCQWSHNLFAEGSLDACETEFYRDWTNGFNSWKLGIRIVMPSLLIYRKINKNLDYILDQEKVKVFPTIQVTCNVELFLNLVRSWRLKRVEMYF